MTNSRPAFRKDDTGIHAACCNTNTWKATQGSGTVFINSKEAVRLGDQTKHCGGSGTMIEGSDNVMIGGAAGSGGGGGSGGGSSSGQGGAGTDGGVGNQTGTNSNQSGSGGGGGGGAAAGGAGTAGSSAAGSQGPAAAAAAAEAEKQKKKDEDPNVHVVSANLSTPGGQPLAFELVKLVKKGKDDKDEDVAGPELTDIKGHVAFVVDEEGEYDFVVIGESLAEHAMPPNDKEVMFELHCQFLDDGVPAAGEKVQISGPGYSGTMTLDAAGSLELPVGSAGEYELTVNKQKFTAHALRTADFAGAFEFQLQNTTDKKADFAKARANRYSPSTRGEK
jgi:hypothetical protein